MIEISLTQGKVARIDEEDLPLISRYSWYTVCSRGQWYAVTGRPPIGMHRFILPTAEGFTPDHIDGDGLNNTRDNLRAATRLEQRRNTGKRAGAKHSPFKGVTLHRDTSGRSRWCAEIKIDGRRIRKYAASEREAALLYNALAREHFGDFARLNEVPA